MRLGVDFSWKQLVGERPNQQDSCRITSFADGDRTDSILLALADGMGGHVGGAEASRIAVEHFTEVAIDRIKAAMGSGGEQHVRDHISQALEEANAAVGRTSRSNLALQGMGTTLVGALVEPRFVEWVSVGDSPFWLWRDGKFTRLNKDHSIGGELKELVANGEISPEEAARHPHRHMLRYALVGEKLPKIGVDAGLWALETGDILMIASDGVETLEENELAAILSRQRNASAAELVENCLHEVERRHAPMQDNVTILVVRVGMFQGTNTHAYQ